jgi:hypothetical protein
MPCSASQEPSSAERYEGPLSLSSRGKASSALRHIFLRTVSHHKFLALQLFGSGSHLYLPSESAISPQVNYESALSCESNNLAPVEVNGSHRKPYGAHLASDPVTDIPESLTSRGRASAGLFPAGRSLDCRANPATSATARSKTDDQYDGSVGDEFRCASARRFDGVVRSILAVARCGCRVRFGRPGMLLLSASQ